MGTSGVVVIVKPSAIQRLIKKGYRLLPMLAWGVTALVVAALLWWAAPASSRFELVKILAFLGALKGVIRLALPAFAEKKSAILVVG